MAAKVIEADLTTCMICLEQFTIPKYLPCLHTFCESCIRVYITSVFEKGCKISIDCPVCRQIVKTPEEGCSAEQWAKLLPINFLLVGLIEKHKVQRPEKLCMSCERKDAETKTKAIFVCIECSDTLCATCVQYHKINKSSSAHEIIAVTDITEGEMHLKVFRNICSVHQSKELELFCEDHELPCCALCVAVHHRKCDKVVTLEDAAKTFMNTNGIDELKRQIKDLSDDLQETLNVKRKYLSKLESERINELNKSESYWKNVHEQLQRIEEMQKTEYNKQFETRKSEAELSITEFENRKKTIDNDLNILTVSVQEASEVQVMIEVQKLKEHVTQYKSSLKKTIDEHLIKFEFKQDIDRLIDQLEKTCFLESKLETQTLVLSSFSKEKTHESVQQIFDDDSNDSSDDSRSTTLSLNSACAKETEREKQVDKRQTKGERVKKRKLKEKKTIKPI